MGREDYQCKIPPFWFHLGSCFAIQDQIMRRFLRLLLGLCALFLVTVTGWGVDFKLTNGDFYTGYAASITDDGLVVRLEKGGFSPRVGWGGLSQETLKEIANSTNALGAKFASPFIDKTQDERQSERAAKKMVTVKDVPRVQLPTGKQKFLPALGTPVGLLILLALYLANLYAAAEIARFRSRPVFVVVGVSMLFPIVGPILYLIVPDDSSGGESTEGSGAVASVVTPTAVEEKKPAPGALGVAGHGKAAAVDHGPQVFKRTDTTFDRRFFETKLSGFFRIVPTDGDRDKVLVFRTPKVDYTARRISRITATEIHLQMLQGSTEVGVQFDSIIELTIRHKDAK